MGADPFSPKKRRKRKNERITPTFVSRRRDTRVCRYSCIIHASSSTVIAGYSPIGCCLAHRPRDEQVVNASMDVVIDGLYRRTHQTRSYTSSTRHSPRRYKVASIQNGPSLSRRPSSPSQSVRATLRSHEDILTRFNIS